MTKKSSSKLHADMAAALSQSRALVVCDVIGGYPGVTIGELAEMPEIAGVQIFEVLKALQARSQHALTVPVSVPALELAVEPAPEAVLLKPKSVRLKILEALVGEYNGLHINEISAKLSIQPAKLSYHLRELLKDGAITKAGIPLKTRYSLVKADRKESKARQTARRSPSQVGPEAISSPEVISSPVTFQGAEEIDPELQEIARELERIERQDREQAEAALEREQLAQISAAKAESKPNRRKAGLEERYPGLVGAKLQKGLPDYILEKASDLAERLRNGKRAPNGAQLKQINASGGSVYSVRLSDGHRMILHKEDGKFVAVEVMTREHFRSTKYA